MEQRKKSHSVLLDLGSRKVSLELFPAALFPSRSAAANLYRLRIDGKWHNPGADKYTFLPCEKIGALIATLLAGAERLAEAPKPPRGLVRKQNVRVHYGDCVDGLPVQTGRGWVLVPPHVAADGRYWVWVYVPGAGEMLVPVEDVELV